MLASTDLATWSERLTRPVDLFYAISYEPRALVSLQRTLEKVSISRVFVFRLNVEDYLDAQTLSIWRQHEASVTKLLTEKQIPFEIFRIEDSADGPVRRLDSLLYSESLPLIDITTFPKNHILRLAQHLVEGNYPVAFCYTSSPRHEAPTQEDSYVGTQRIVPVDGFEGETFVNGDTIVTLCLGFEGNRALQFATEFPAARIVALLGAPSANPDEEDGQFYLTEARIANRNLLKNSFVEEVIVNSRDPNLFARQLRDIIQRAVARSEEANVVIVPLGTKAQTLGIFQLWRENPWLQVLYSIPSRRSAIAVSTGETRVFTISPHESDLQLKIARPVHRR